MKKRVSKIGIRKINYRTISLVDFFKIINKDNPGRPNLDAVKWLRKNR